MVRGASIKTSKESKVYRVYKVYREFPERQGLPTKLTRLDRSQGDLPLTQSLKASLT
jgi:hypothetical protein